MMKSMILVVALSCFVAAVAASDCKHAQNCSSCIQTPNCIWCGKSGEFSNGEQSYVRCIDRADNVLDEWTESCGSVDIYQPENFYKLVRNDDLAQAGVLAGSAGGASGAAAAAAAGSAAAASSQESLIQMRPQRVQLNLRVRESQSLQVTFRQAEDYPVDLYYLMDLSKSMEDDKDSLSALGATLADEMQKITRNFRLGFGSFVDKIVMPYVSTVPEKLVAPCRDCARPYGFRNALHLNDNASLFVINQVAKEDNINIIFAVTAEQTSVYTRLAEIIEGSSTGQLTANSSNIVDLVKTEYSKITSKVELKDNAAAPVHIRYFSRCKGGPEVETSVCDNLHVGDQVEFRAEVTLDSCPTDPTLWRQLIEISPVALSDKLIIELQMLCDCACERPGHRGNQPASDLCDGHGTYQCGVCSCDSGYLGRHCECGSDTPLGSGEVDDSSCKATNTSKICSGQGSCNCGECVCNDRDNPDEIISGKYCDCTNFLCDRHDGELCSGPSHGVCECDRCVCRPGWTGDACQCMNSTHNCVNPDTGIECSGNGKCECNQCKCFETDGGRYSGKWCEDCPTCTGKCLLYKACVQCQVFGTGELDEDECAENCTLFNSTKVDVATGQCGGCGHRSVWWMWPQVSVVDVATGQWGGCGHRSVWWVWPQVSVVGVATGQCGGCDHRSVWWMWQHEVSTLCHSPLTLHDAHVSLNLLSTQHTRCLDAHQLCGLEFQCSHFKECVECRVFEAGPLMEEPGACERCSLLYSDYTSRLVANYSINVTDWVEAEEGERSCSFFDENDCRFTFVYGYGENKEPLVRVQQTLECPPKVDILAIVLGVIGAIVAVGVALLLMWKVLTTIHDRREYAQFEKERMMAKWDTGENPIYKQATSTFKNPMYGGK
ncbi:Integrin beta subunit VWA domain [Trinorchestia longiramus]|nr:Integrin beta subunit VWA domain [Trinorchestia longiramus]